MPHHHYLDLPENPLKDQHAIFEKHRYRPGSFRYEQEDPSVLTDEVLDLLSKSGLEVEFVTIFRANPSYDGTSSTAQLHRDVGWRNGRWQSIPFGVNWEISGNRQSIMCWYDTGQLEEVWPGDPNLSPPSIQRHTGVHYGQRAVQGIPDQCVLIAQAKLDRATLIRADVPHTVFFSGEDRMSISVRFRQYLEWPDAVLAFRDLIVSS